jgi:hypothetical protein
MIGRWYGSRPCQQEGTDTSGREGGVPCSTGAKKNGEYHLHLIVTGNPFLYICTGSVYIPITYLLFSRRKHEWPRQQQLK